MNKSGIASQVVAHPKGGGAIVGLGDSFTPDLHTGTGNMTVPIAVPSGRHGFQPDLSLVYSTGHGNGPFGLGWQLGIPGVTRDTRRGVPLYMEGTDTFLLSGSEQLVSVGAAPDGSTLYRPRTEGAFARIQRHVSDQDDYWEVWSRNGFRSRYGRRATRGSDPSVVRNPDDPLQAFSWSLTETTDAFGNRIEYFYERETDGEDGPVPWDQTYVKTIRYVDFGAQEAPQYLVSVDFIYEPRPDPFSSCRAGFEIRTTRRCVRIEIRTHADEPRLTREVRFTYTDPQEPSDSDDAISLLRRIEVEGIDGDAREPLPPLDFAYTAFNPSARRYRAITAPGEALPHRSLGDPDFELADLFGRGLPDIVQIGEVNRYWKNLGGGRFDVPRPLEALPPDVRLRHPGTLLADLDGDGQVDVLVSHAALNGYFPLTAAVSARGRPFVFSAAPPFTAADPELRLVDLNGDGITDALRTGVDLELFLHDRATGWTRLERRTRGDFDHFPDVHFSDPRVKLADMNGDGLQDIVFVGEGHAEYWPCLGYGRFGRRVAMGGRLEFRDAAHFGGVGFDPRRLLLGDVDGDGLADLVYVESGRVTVWLNQSGNRWSAPLVIHGTPAVTDTDAVRLADMLGQGTEGILWTYDYGTFTDSTYKFLDLTGGVKPYLLSERTNNAGARTRITYASSTALRVEDDQRAETRWRSRLPFPVQVVSRVDSVDEISGGTLTSEYRYHQGYWDGEEREFRGFGLVEQFDSEIFTGKYTGAAPESFTAVEAIRFSPPILTRTWFHQGEIRDADGTRREPDASPGAWAGDPGLFGPQHRIELVALAEKAEQSGHRTRLRDALRALKGVAIRSETYALDGSANEARPYSVTESLHDVRLVTAEETGGGPGVYFPFPRASRTTHWERGADPMTEITFTDGYDEYGLPRSRLAVAVPRGREPLGAATGPLEPYLATFTVTEYARRDDADKFIVDRGARATGYEVVNDGTLSVFGLRDAVLDGRASRRVVSHARTYYDGAAFTGLPLGHIGEFGAPVRSESLVFTDDFLTNLFGPEDPGSVRPPYLGDSGHVNWTPEYPDGFRAALPQRAGYVHYQDDQPAGSPGGYYSISACHKYDFQDPDAVPRGLPRVTRDPLGTEAGVEHDRFDLLPVRSVDAIGLTTTAEYDYRIMQLRRTTEPNGNVAEFRYSPAGFLTAQFLRGKNGEGDVEHPTLRFEYDLLAFAREGRPMFVRSIRRLHHDGDGDVAPEERGATVESIEYSDGLGRLLQTRSQAEDTMFGDAAFGGSLLPLASPDATAPIVGRTRQATDPVNVAVNGATTYDNKGRPVEQFEPFFDRGWDYQAPAAAQHGQKSVLFYDARGRVVRTLNPDGSQQLAVFGVPEDLSDPSTFVPTPWEVYTYDAHDNAGRTHPEATSAFSHHWNTPTSIVFDALGRTISATGRNGRDPAADSHSTRSKYDIQGNLLAVTDGLGRTAFSYVYDLMKRTWRVDSIDGGRRDGIPNPLGDLVETRDSKGALTLHAYDRVHRLVRVWARDRAGTPIGLRQRLEYGDGGRVDQPSDERRLAQRCNLLGQVTRHYDEAGLVVVGLIDFKGNVLEKSRRLVADAPMLEVFTNAPANGWQISPFRIDWDSATQPLAGLEAALLEPESYETTAAYDALNRLKHSRLPKDVHGRRLQIVPTYNAAGGMERILLDGEVFVERILYDAKGQRALVCYGNGVLTRYAYDPRTFRLARLRSETFREDDRGTYVPTGSVLQDCRYTHDLAGNLMGIEERVHGCGVVNNPDAQTTGDAALARLVAAGDALIRRFTYDPLYRLQSATGRECDIVTGGEPWLDPPRCADLTRSRLYTERYEYDRVGNLRSLRHANGTGAFVRQFDAAPASNRLASVAVGQQVYSYTSDANGNLTKETTSRHFEWDHADRMTVFRTQTTDAEPSVYAQYLYDAAGRRLKQLVRKQGGVVQTTHYVTDTFEHHRWSNGAENGANNYIHVHDDKCRVALVRVGPAAPGDAAPPVQFQLGDHLGSATAVVDAAGSVINREEFTPYGETSFGSFARKRYRFTGCQRDEESGLNHHGSRYYSPGLGRWISADPTGLAGGSNLFAYAGGNPIMLVDCGGTQPGPADDLPRDEEGNIYVGHELIEIHDTAPPMDPYEKARRGGTTNIVTRDEFERQRNSAQHPAGRKRSLYDDVADAMWITDPEGTAAQYYGQLNAEYEAYRRPKEAALEEGWKRTDRAVGAVHDILKFQVIGAGGAAAIGVAGGVVPLAKGLGWSALYAGATSDGGYSGCGALAGFGGGPAAAAGRAEAQVTERAIGRATATQANVLDVENVTRTVAAATGRETFVHTTSRAAFPHTAESAAVAIAETKVLNLSTRGEVAHWGQGAYAYEGAIAGGDNVLVQFSVPKGTAIERITIPGQTTIVRLVPAEGNVLQLVNPVTNLTSQQAASAAEWLERFVRPLAR